MTKERQGLSHSTIIFCLTEERCYFNGTVKNQLTSFAHKPMHILSLPTKRIFDLNGSVL